MPRAKRLTKGKFQDKMPNTRPNVNAKNKYKSKVNAIGKYSKCK